jgi:hypothetical protein
MNFSDVLTSYTAEIVDIMQEVRAKMQRVQEIKAEIDKLKQIETKTTKTTPNNNKISCACGCTINKSSWYSHIKTKKHLKKLEEVKEIKPVEEIKPVVNDETDDDDDDEIHDHHVDKEINNIKEIFYEGLYVRNYEHQNFLDISIRNAIHKNYKINKKYKLSKEEINNILDEHLETYPIKYNKQTKTKDEITEQILNAKMFKGVPNHYLIKDSDMKHIKKVISNNIYPDYADMMNRFVDLVLVRDYYKQLVIEAFSDHRAKYGVDDAKIREYLTTLRMMD